MLDFRELYYHHETSICNLSRDLRAQSLQFPRKMITEINKKNPRNLNRRSSISFSRRNKFRRNNCNCFSLLPIPWNFSGGPVTLSYIYSHIYVTCSTNQNPNTKAQNIPPLLVGITLIFSSYCFSSLPPKKKKKELWRERDSRFSRSARVAYLTLNHLLSLYYYSLIVIIN